MDQASQPEVASGTTERLTRGLSAGDEHAFAEFHALYFDRLYQFLLVVARGHEDEAQEALQQTLLRVLRYARVFDEAEPFWCWLKTLARSAARDTGRKQQRYTALLHKFSLRSQSAVEDQNLEEDQLQGLLKDSLEELDPIERGLLERKYLEGATIKELSLETGLSEKAVESRLWRLRREIRERLVKKLKNS